MTNCKYIDHYIEMVRNSDPLPYCKRQIQLCNYIEKVFQTEEVWVDVALAEEYFKLEKYFGFELLPWERFVFVLHVCTFTKEGFLRFPYLFCNVGRGAGKNGLLSFICFCLITPLNKVDRYDIYIYAMSEEQAKTSWMDIYEILEANKKKMKNIFYWTKEVIQHKKTRSRLIYCSSSVKTHDGQRPGLVAFDEYHQYLDMKLVGVATGGLGKVDDSRKTIVTTNGLVRGGPFDALLQDAFDLLDGVSEDDGGYLYFVCMIDEFEEMHDEKNWFKANPSLYPAMKTYYSMMREIRLEYKDYMRNPAEHPEFPAKRMNYPPKVMENEVIPWEYVLKTNQEIDEDLIRGMPCVAGYDYMKTTDFLSAGILYLVRDKYYWIQHTWICRHSKDLNRIKAPLDYWAQKGDVSYVDADEIPPDLPVAWCYNEAAKRGSTIVNNGVDEYRFALLKNSLLSFGFSPDKEYDNVKKIRPSDEMKHIPLITSGFIREAFCWGDTPVMRWAVNNAKVEANKHGNFTYEKIEPKSRKTDPFKAFVAAFCTSEVLEQYAYQADQPEMSTITF